MTDIEFEKIWRLLGTLFPNAAAKKKAADVAVWKKGLSDYAMPDVSERIMQYAQKNKYFPDLADITKGLTTAAAETGHDAEIIHNAKLYGKIIGVDPPEFANGAEALEWARGQRS